MAEHTWRTRPTSHGRLQVEELEGRLTPAGNVTALLLGGNLLVFGDSAANSVEITATGGNLVVSGHDGTTVNGGSAVTFSGVGSVSANLVVALGRGADTANIHDVAVGGYAAIDGGVLASFFSTGPGDQLTLTNVKVGSYLIVATGGTDDTVALNGVQVGDATAIVTYGGSDKVTISGSQLNGALLVATGAGNDSVAIDTTTVGGFTAVALGSGDDTLSLTGDTFKGAVFLDGGPGTDKLTVDAATTFAVAPVELNFE
jgi:large repetitive protein